MKQGMLWIVALTTLVGSTLCGQDISGNWQGTLKTGIDLRLIVEIAKGEGGGWKATMYSSDQTTNAIPVSSVTLEGSNLKFTVDMVRGTFEGKVSADGDSIAGTWSQGQPLPLELRRATKETAWQRDPTAHTVQFVNVEKDVKLEVLDWGGTGRPLVLLTGLGDNAHRFDKFALKLTGTYHVYGITRRGFGASSAPEPNGANYSADRLGDDVLDVIDALKINKPVLVGHSIGGEELSSIGSRHPERVAGLIYLDAGYSYAFDNGKGMTVEAQQELAKSPPPQAPPPNAGDRASFAALLAWSARANGVRPPEAEFRQTLTMAADGSVGMSRTPPKVPPAIMAGFKKFTDINRPVLAIYAIPKAAAPWLKDADPAVRAAVEAFSGKIDALTEKQVKEFENGVPGAKVVRLPDP